MRSVLFPLSLSQCRESAVAFFAAVFEGYKVLAPPGNVSEPSITETDPIPDSAHLNHLREVMQSAMNWAGRIRERLAGQLSMRGGP